jgi:hypothetical protein
LTISQTARLTSQAKTGTAATKPPTDTVLVRAEQHRGARGEDERAADQAEYRDQAGHQPGGGTSGTPPTACFTPRASFRPEKEGPVVDRHQGLADGDPGSSVRAGRSGKVLSAS